MPVAVTESVVTSVHHLPVRVRSEPCDFCGSRARRLLYADVRDYDLDWPDAYAVVECIDCGLAFVDPRPLPSDIHVYYPPHYNPFNPAQVGGPLAWVKKFFEHRKAKKVLRLLGPTGSILDVGCAYGGFLDRLRAVGQWELFGIDTDAQSIAYARSQLGLRADVLPFEALAEETAYNCVVMKYVLDHLPSPAAAFAKLSSIVRPGGYLVLQLPNRASWEARVFGRYWHGWEVPRHSVYFTLPTLQKYAEGFGFRLVEVEHEATPNSWVWGLRYLALDHARPLARFCTLGNPFLLLLTTPLGALAALFRQSGRVEYVLQRDPSEEPL